MNKQKGYFLPDITSFFLILIMIGIVVGYTLSFVLPFVWTSLIKPLLLTLV